MKEQGKTHQRQMPPNHRPRPKPLIHPRDRIIPITQRLLIPAQCARDVGVDAGDERVADGGGGGVEGGGHPDLPVGFCVGVSGVERDAVGSWEGDGKKGEREGGERRGWEDEPFTEVYHEASADRRANVR